jgi:hypothetical protein
MITIFTNSNVCIVAPVHELEHKEQEHKNQQCERQHHAHSAPVLLFYHLVLLESLFVRYGLRALAGGTQLPIAVARLRLIDMARCIVESIGLGIGVITYALEAFGESLSVLEVTSVTH